MEGGALRTHKRPASMGGSQAAIADARVDGLVAASKSHNKGSVCIAGGKRTLLIPAGMKLSWELPTACDPTWVVCAWVTGIRLASSARRPRLGAPNRGRSNTPSVDI